jgi:transposase
MRKAEKLHRHSAGQLGIMQAIATMIELLGQQIAALDRQIAGFITEGQVLAEQVRLLTAVARIGPTC